MEADAFSLALKVPPELTHAVYCSPCFDQKVAAPLAEYEEVLELAKNVYVFTKSQSNESRLIKRKLPMIRIENCDDHDETVMRLAFAAVKTGSNAIVDVDVTSKKEKDGSYQTTKWYGTAIPVKVDSGKMEAGMEIVNTNPN
jgi:hypothetical protein